MRAGRLDRLIDIQRSTASASDSGEQVVTWSNIVSRRAAGIAPIQGSERFITPQVSAMDQLEFRIRLFSDVANLTARDRIIYPAMAASSPPGTPAEGQIYNILSINEIGRREGLRIIATRRPDTATMQQIVAGAGLAVGGGGT